VFEGVGNATGVGRLRPNSSNEGELEGGRFVVDALRLYWLWLIRKGCCRDGDRCDAGRLVYKVVGDCG
jgi:hypothetical protein